MSVHPTRAMASAIAVSVLSVTTGVVATAAPKEGQPTVPPTRCQWTTDQLPRTPDAVEGWYRGCPPFGLPSSPTGVEGWTAQQ